MKYLLMFGHGQFPPGLHNALTTFASDTPDLMYCNLENGMDTDKYVENLKKKLEVIDPQKDEIIILSDLPGGSPLTNVIAVLGEMEMLEHCVIYTGMNLPLAINVVMTKDSTTLDKLDELVLADTQAKREEAKRGIAGDIDRMEAKREKKIARETQLNDTFKEIALEWHSSKLTKWSAGYA